MPMVARKQRNQSRRNKMDTYNLCVNTVRMSEIEALTRNEWPLYLTKNESTPLEKGHQEG